MSEPTFRDVRLLAFRRVWRYITIYGPGRTWFKIRGRLRLKRFALYEKQGIRNIGVIGCGQFAFATIGYFLHRRFGSCILGCYDIDIEAASSLARGFGVTHICEDAHQLLDLPGLHTVYIASNHASHAMYAVAALRRGLDVYVEKPVAVTLEQLALLERARLEAFGRLFSGYNRPFSSAIRNLFHHIQIQSDSGMSMQCFVVGHVLSSDHWYRHQEEGTRICGNVGHWLDLFVHLLNWREMPDRFEVSLTWANDEERDDNLSISISTDRQDLCTIMLTSRAEPFEGINESIQFQHGETFCKIDDFRCMTLWKGSNVVTHRFWPKDQGHRGAIYQPFDDLVRPWQEVLDSSLLMLHITEMVRKATRFSIFSLFDARKELVSRSR